MNANNTNGFVNIGEAKKARANGRPTSVKSLNYAYKPPGGGGTVDTNDSLGGK